MPGRIKVSELTEEQRKEFGFKRPKEHVFSKEKVRGRAIDILSKLTDVKQSERKRILSQALKINEV